jgi:hypothetical protein
MQMHPRRFCAYRQSAFSICVVHALRGFKKALRAAGFFAVKNSIAILVTREIEH